LPDDSVDFVFSFDSFVHIDREIVDAYLGEIGRILKPGGKGFIHHSNFGAFASSFRERLPRWITKPLIKLNILDWAHHRNPSMNAELFRDLCEQHGLHCVNQELVNWRGRRLIDCLSLFVRSDSRQEPTRIIRNPNFMREASRIRLQAGLAKQN
jgi:SAM-dependent methyltransferase